jgi:hypothetical protein
MGSFGDWDTAQLHAESIKKKPVVIPPQYELPWRTLAIAIQSREVKERPGMVQEMEVEEMLTKFHAVFTPSEAEKHSKRETLGERLQQMRTSMQQRYGQDSAGWIDWERSAPQLFDIFTVDLNLPERVFFTVSIGESSATVSQVISVTLIITIVLSITSWMVSTLPEFRQDIGVCNGTEVGDCKPEPKEAFKYIDSTCVVLFTVEYLIKIFFVSWVRFEIMDDRFLHTVLGKKSVSDYVLEDDVVETKTTLDDKFKTLTKWVLQPSNLIDIIAIMPFWIEQIAQSGGGNSVFVILRILRLTRIFRVFKIGKYNEIFTLFGRVMVQSLPALYLMLFFVGLGLCLFGTLIWFAEQGHWHPPGNARLLELGIDDRGAYLRNAAFLPGVESWSESPYPSIIHTFWFVIVTVTTVGYGDSFPTTRGGKLVGAVTILCGVVVLAMPVGVIGANFSNEYDRSQMESKRKEKLKQQRLAKEEQRKLHMKAANNGSVGKAGQISHDDLVDMEIADELREVSAIIDRAMAMDAELTNMLKEGGVLHRLRKDLREFMQDLLNSRKQAGCSDVTVSLDLLTYRIFSQIRDVSDGAGQKDVDAPGFRQRWFEFMDQCWVYWNEHPPKQQAPQEIFELKGQLLKLPGVNLPG